MSVIAEIRPTEADRGTRASPAHIVREGIVEIPGRLALHHGGALAGVRIAWRMVGAVDAPVICALGGISATRRVCLTAEPRQSWWREMAGPGRPLDTERCRILSFDYLVSEGKRPFLASSAAGTPVLCTVVALKNRALPSTHVVRLNITAWKAILGRSNP
jgi:homoserine acetyltransferase